MTKGQKVSQNGNNIAGKSRLSKPLTVREKAKRQRKYRKDQLVRKLKKAPLRCVTVNFLDFAARCGWDKETTDAAALVMHKYFLETRKKKKRGYYYLTAWARIHSKYFSDVLGSGYKKFLATMEKAGFLERKNILKYVPGKLSSGFRLGREFLLESYTASYHLQTERLQRRILDASDKLHQLTADKKRRKALAQKMLDEAFPTTEYPIDDTVRILQSGRTTTYHIPKFLKYIADGTFTLEQLQVYKRIVRNVYQLKLNISEPELLAITTKRHQVRKPRCDVSALQEVYRSYLEDVLVPRVSIDPQGRMYTPYTSLPREFWDHVTYKGNALAAIDVKTSQVYCLLALVKDIDRNYFGGSPFQTHAERLTRCRFGRQIASIPGLDDHLRRCSGLLQASNFYDFMGQESRDRENLRKRCLGLFTRFTKFFLRTLQPKGCEAIISKQKYEPDETDQKPSKFMLGLFTSKDHLSLLNNILDAYSAPCYGSPSNLYSSSHVSNRYPDTTPAHPVTVNDIKQNIYHNQYMNHELTMILYALKYTPNVEKFIPILADVRHENTDVRHEITQENDVGHGDVGQNIPRFRDLFFPCREEIEAFEEILSGDIYDQLMAAINVKGKQSRDDFKEFFFHFLYRPACVRKEKIVNAVGPGERYIERYDEPIRKAFENFCHPSCC